MNWFKRMAERIAALFHYNNKKYIFISYSHADRLFTEETIKMLEDHGYRVKYDKNIPFGEIWANVLLHMINKCTVFIALVCNDYAISEQCIKELELADKRNDLVKYMIADSDNKLSEIAENVPIIKKYFDERQFLIWDFSDPKASFQKIQGIKGIEQCRDGNRTPEMNSTIAEACRKTIENIRLHHPSFSMLENQQWDSSLSPISLQDNQTLKKLIIENWKQPKQTHIYIEGKGGIGKTVALLSLFSDKEFMKKLSDIPVVYIPLYALASCCSIDEYIKKKCNFSERFAMQILQAQQNRSQWDEKKGPAIALLLDGFNEVPLMSRAKVENMIHKWAVKNNVMIISTSRIQFDLYAGDYKKIELESLNRQKICEYLENHGVEVPDEKTLKLLDTPLMLKLYTEYKRFIGKYSFEIVSFREAHSASDLIYNYLQRELLTLLRRDEKDANARHIDIAFSFLCIWPYIAWKMARDTIFAADGETFAEWIKEATGYWHAHELPQIMKSLEEYFEQELSDVKERWLCSRQRQILVKHQAVFMKTGEENIYRPVHQNFRDGLAAIHLYNIACVSPMEMLKELKDSLSEDILRYLAGLMDEEMLRGIWDANKQSTTATTAILKLYFFKHDQNLQDIDFSGMDLREINLYQFRTNDGKLLLSDDPTRFHDTRIAAKCFSPSGHTDDITCLALNNNEAYLASVGKDRRIMVWNLETGMLASEPIVIDKVVKKLIFSSDSRLLIALHDDGTLATYNIENHEINNIEIKQPQLIDAISTLIAAYALYDNGTIVKKQGDAYTFSQLPVAATPLRLYTDHGNHFIASKHDDDSFVIFDDNLQHIATTKATGDCIAFNMQEQVIVFADHRSFKQHSLREGTTLTRQAHASNIKAISFNGDGSYFITVSELNEIKLWNTTNHKEIEERNTVTSSIILDCAMGMEERDRQFLDALSKHFNSDSFSDSSNRLDSYELLFSLAASKDGMRIAVACSTNILLWDKHANNIAVLSGHTDWVRCIAMDQSGTWLCSGSNDKTARFWNTETNIYKQLSTDTYINAIAMDNEATLVAIGLEDGSSILWHTQSDEKEYIPSHHPSIKSIAINPEGTILAIGYNDAIAIYDIPRKQFIREKEHNDPIRSLVLQEDTLFYSDDQDIRQWNWLNDSQKDLHINETSKAIAIEDGLLAVATEKNIFLYDILTSTRLYTWSQEDPVPSISFIANGTSILAGSNPPTIKLYSVLTQRIEQLNARPQTIMHTMGFTPERILVTDIAYDDNTHVFASLSSGMVMETDIYDHSMQKMIGQATREKITSLSLIKEENALILSNDKGEVYVIDRSTGETLVPRIQLHNAPIKTTAYAIDKENDIGLLFTGGEDMKITWFKHNKIENTEVKSFKNPVNEIKYIPLEKKIICGTEDGIMLTGFLNNKKFNDTKILHGYSGKQNSISLKKSTIYAPTERQIHAWDLNESTPEGKLVFDAKPAITSCVIDATNHTLLVTYDNNTQTAYKTNVNVSKAIVHHNDTIECKDNNNQTVEVIHLFPGIDISSLDLAQAIIVEEELEIFSQNNTLGKTTKKGRIFKLFADN